MHKLLLPLAAVMILFAANSVVAQQTDETDPQATWDLTDLYPSVEAWSKARDEVMADFEKIDGMRGSLGKSADSLYTTYRFVSDTFRKAGRVYVYASLNADEDLRKSETQERRQLAGIMFARFGEVTAWMQPELIQVGREIIESYIKEDERLAPFAFQIDDSLRNAAHTLSPETEQTLSYFSQTFGAPNDIYSLLANSDIPWPTITLSDGEEIVVDSQGYGKVRGSANRDDRKLAFDAFWNTWAEYRSSVGMVMNSHLQTQVGLAKARHYDSVLDRELFEDNLPPAVYHTLVTEVNKALPTLHRYFKLRTRMLGLEQMHYYDIYPPLVTLNREFDLDTSKKITLEAMGRPRQ